MRAVAIRLSVLLMLPIERNYPNRPGDSVAFCPHPAFAHLLPEGEGARIADFFQSIDLIAILRNRTIDLGSWFWIPMKPFSPREPL